MHARSSLTRTGGRALSVAAAAALVAALTGGLVVPAAAVGPTLTTVSEDPVPESPAALAPRLDWSGPVDGTWTFAFVSEEVDVTEWSYALDWTIPAVPFAGTDARHAVLELPDLAVGGHDLTVWATDASGVVTEILWSFEVEASGPDATPPVLLDTTRTFEDGAWVFRFQVDEEIGTWTYRLDNGADVGFDGTDARNAELRFAGLPAGPHDVQVWMTDLAGNTTWYRWVFNVDTPVDEPEPHPAPAPPATPQPAPATPAPAQPAPAPAPVATPVLASDAIPARVVARGIARGATGPSVALVQRLLGVPDDGRFGRQTAAAVRAFQRAHGLVPDGVVGPLTWAALVDVANGGSGFPTVSATSIPQALVLRGVRQGARGQAVVTIQRLVGATPDGRFGPRTRLAVQAWQRTHGLVADGVVGRLTWAALATPR